MRQASFISFFSLAITAMSTPISHTPRQPPMPQIIAQEVNSVSTTVNDAISTTLNAVSDLAKDGTAQVQLIATIKLNLGNIESQLESAGEAIKSSIAGLSTSLTGPEIQTLITTFQRAKAFVTNLQLAYQTMQNDLSGDTFAAVKADYATTVAAIQPFTDPMIIYLEGATAAGQEEANLLLNAILGAASSLGFALGALLGSVGISQ